jgi:hypothetical protein
VDSEAGSGVSATEAVVTGTDPQAMAVRVRIKNSLAKGRINSFLQGWMY